MRPLVIVDACAVGEDRALLLEPFGDGPLGLALARRMADDGGLDVRVATCCGALLAEAGRRGLRAVAVPEAVETREPLDRAEFLLSMLGPLPQGAPSCLLSWRAPLLSPEDVREALRIMGEKNAPLVMGVMSVRDHPCQCRAPLRLASMYFVARLDPGSPSGWEPGNSASASAFRQIFPSGVGRWSRPHLSWGRFLGYDMKRKGLYGLLFGEANPVLEPLDKVLREFGVGLGGGVVYCLAGGDAARKWVPEAVCSQFAPLSLEGVGFFEQAGMEDVLLLGAPGDGPAGIYMKEALHKENAFFRIIPLKRGRFSAPHFDVWPDKQLRRIPASSGEYIGPLGVVPDGHDAYLLMHLECCSLDAAAVYEPLEVPGCGWRVELSGVIRNLATGEALYGRQAFPQAYRCEDTLLALAPGAAGGLGALWRSGAAVGCTVRSQNSLVIRNEIDLLRARLRAGELLQHVGSLGGNHD